MEAHVISEVEILDEGLADRYRALAAASIAEYGGRYLARGAEAEVVEGPTSGRRASREAVSRPYLMNSYEAMRLGFTTTVEVMGIA
jgi:uncharacterized protein (DUF1330 family)